MRIFITLIALLFTGISYAQIIRGSLKDPATPAINPMDPNGDSLITSTGLAFTGPLDETEFEIPFIPILQYQAEPGDDNQYSPGCELYDLINDPAVNAASGYYYYKDPDSIPDNGDELMFFRFRVARFSEGSTGFSILMDTDYTFGFSGPESDPNAVPGNPGFELEIATFNSTGSDGGVRVFNVDGMDTAAVVKHYASINSNYQMSWALNQDPGCSISAPASDKAIPVFVDMYMPFSALGILSTTQIRMAVAANEDPKTSLGGGASDIGGVNGHLITDDDDQFIAAILNYSPIAIGNSSNQAPVVDDVSTSLDENSANGTVVHTVSGTDPNGDVLRYTITSTSSTSGNVSMAFAIDSISGEITVNNSAVLDAETTSAFTLLVRVSDGKLYNNAIITINLNDVNEYPPSATDAAFALNENTTNNTVVHTVVATDPDITPVLGYSITEGNTGIAFAINSSSGEITVNNSSALDFETTPSFTLTVHVSDGAFFDDAIVTVKLNDVNDPPVINGATISLPENTIDSTVVHSVVASDADLPAAILEYSITGGNDRLAFAIDQEGLITVDSSRILDFETTPVFSLTVRVSDGELFSEAIVTINLVDVNERPTVKGATVRIDENLPNGTFVHQVIATDQDANDVLTFSLERGNTDSGFSINENTGELMINNSDSVDFILNPVFELIVRAQDRAGLAGRARIRVELINIPEKSDFNPLKGVSPDGDGINDFWVIQGIDVFTDNEVKVFNRWGNLVFETSHYDNVLIVWRGESNGKMVLTGQQVIDSTYYYIIRINGLREPITGYVIVKK